MNGKQKSEASTFWDKNSEPGWFGSPAPNTGVKVFPERASGMPAAFEAEVLVPGGSTLGSTRILCFSLQSQPSNLGALKWADGPETTDDRVS